MNQNQFDTLLRSYEVAHFILPFGPIQRGYIKSVVEYAVTNGFLQEVEQKNPYTFGGKTVHLTDTELAMFMRLLSDGSKIQAIKMLRIDVSDKGLTLREAKDFADHLDSILSKSRS